MNIESSWGVGGKEERFGMKKGRLSLRGGREAENESEGKVGETRGRGRELKK